MNCWDQAANCKLRRALAPQHPKPQAIDGHKVLGAQRVLWSPLAARHANTNTTMTRWRWAGRTAAAPIAGSAGGGAAATATATAACHCLRGRRKAVGRTCAPLASPGAHTTLDAHLIHHLTRCTLFGSSAGPPPSHSSPPRPECARAGPRALGVGGWGWDVCAWGHGPDAGTDALGVSRPGADHAELEVTAGASVSGGSLASTPSLH